MSLTHSVAVAIPLLTFAGIVLVWWRIEREWAPVMLLGTISAFVTYSIVTAESGRPLLFGLVGAAVVGLNALFLVLVGWARDWVRRRARGE
jgi:hypothetical protein